MAVELKSFSWQRMIEAVAAVQERALRATAALRNANVPTPSADVSEIEHAEDYDIVTLEALVRMKLNSFRDKDRTHLRDFISIGLVDATWLPNLLPQHAERLQQLLDDPEG